jgi:hypothetical protein
LKTFTGDDVEFSTRAECDRWLARVSAVAMV